MSRNIFGWSYPPGCSGPPDDDMPDSCPNCGKDFEDFTQDYSVYCSVECEIADQIYNKVQDDAEYGYEMSLRAIPAYKFQEEIENHELVFSIDYGSNDKTSYTVIEKKSGKMIVSGTWEYPNQPFMNFKPLEEK